MGSQVQQRWERDRKRRATEAPEKKRRRLAVRREQERERREAEILGQKIKGVGS